MDLHQLKIFCSVVEAGTFRGAAEKLFLSQPSVSQHVAALEKKHHVRLFDRKGRTIATTPEGRALYVLAKDLLRQAEQIPARFKEMQTLRSGRLEAGASPFAGYYILPAALAGFNEEFPDISVSISSGSPGKILEDLKKGAVELALLGRNFPSTRDPEMTYRTLGKDPLVLAVPPSHPWASGGRAVRSETGDHTLVRFMGDSPLGTYVEEFLLRNKISFGGHMETDDIEIAKHIVMKGVGVAITSSLSVGRELASGDLVSVALDGLEGLYWEIQCVYSVARGLSYAGWEMVKRLEATCRNLLS